MSDDPRVLLLLEEILDSGRAPEDVCRSCPELLPAVLEGLERLKQLESDVAAMFPADGGRARARPQAEPPASPAPAAPVAPRARGRSPDTIVLVHGFWVTPRSWERWIARYEEQGYRVLAPAYPGFEVEVEALNADPSPVERLTLPAILARLESVVGALAAPPILMGHSAGGAFVQILLDRGFGAAGVALNSAPTEGVLVAPWSQIRSTFPVLRSPANRHRAVGLTYEQWRYAFTNTFPEDEARALYARYHVPASGGILWESVLANLQPGRQATWVDYRNTTRPPLLFLSGGEDHLMPPAVQRSNAARYTDSVLTEVTVFEGRSHLLPAQRGWEEIADYALAWAERAASAEPRGR